MRLRPASLALLQATLMWAVTVTGGARAETGAGEEAAVRPKLRWQDRWKRVGTTEYVLTPALAAAGAAFVYVVPDEDEPDWTGPVLFDAAARRTLVAETRTGRNRAKTTSDILYYASIAHPVLIDNLLVTWGMHGAADVAWQMFWINSQAYALSFAVNSGVKRVSARRRPWGDRCPDESGEFPCGEPFELRSFYSGHATITATSAGLVCAHHLQLALYGDPILDTGVCVLAVGLTAATGMLRIASDNHFASDVAVGHIAGYLSGYLMPSLLYYDVLGSGFDSASHSGPRMAVVPLAGPDSAQLGVSGVF